MTQPALDPWRRFSICGVPALCRSRPLCRSREGGNPLLHTRVNSCTLRSDKLQDGSAFSVVPAKAGTCTSNRGWIPAYAESTPRIGKKCSGGTTEKEVY